MKLKKGEEDEKTRKFTSDLADNFSEFLDPFTFNPRVVGEWGVPLDDAQIPRPGIMEIHSIGDQRSCRSKKKKN